VTPPTARSPAAAGRFYPADPAELARTVDALLEGVPSWALAAPRALIVPHAAYAYSGAVAATAYATLRRGPAPHRVLLLGPSHFVPLVGTAVPEAAVWATPLGEVPIDAALREAAVAAGAEMDDAPHALEHALEVQLPFLQRVLVPGSTVLPLAVGVTGTAEVAELIAGLMDASEVLLVSTDLSHYHDLRTARLLDRATAQAVVRGHPSAIGADAACGVFALRGVVELARRRRLDVRLLDLRTSADSTGDPTRVVGYGAFALAETVAA
jgi:MEMO1 family protein